MHFSMPALLFLVPCLSFAASLATASTHEERFPISTSYADVQSFLYNLVMKYPKNAKIFQLGTNNQNQPIEGLQIGSGPVGGLLVSAHHGNEYASTEVAKGVAADLAANPIAGMTIYIVPVLNIGGYNKRSRREAIGLNSFDPNRDYPGACATEGPFNLKSTQALAQLVAEKNIAVSATLHTFYGGILYPWGISAEGNDLKTEYNDLFITLGKLAAQESGDAVLNSTEALYPADGTFEDYAFWKHGIWSFLYELGSSHNPTQAEVDDTVASHVPGVRRLFSQAPSKRAEKHAFTGKCLDKSLSRLLDRHDE